uniref:Uncharacterized protein n=1 Tax=Rhizophora mucronata TaxID=61149 RepID=A0A2P2QHD6_RHIMU
MTLRWLVSRIAFLIKVAYSNCLLCHSEYIPFYGTSENNEYFGSALLSA